MFRIFYAALAIFIAATAVLVLVKTDLGAFIAAGKITPAGDDLSAEQVLDKIASDDIQLRSMAQELTKNCFDAECKAYTLFRHVASKYRIDDNLSWNELSVSPDQLIRSGAGSGAELSVLLLSLIENADIRTRFVVSGDKSYVSACGLSKSGLYRLIADGERGAPLFRDKFRLAAGQVWVASPELYGDGTGIQIIVKSTSPVDLYVFRSAREIFFDEVRKNYFPECHISAETDISASCYMQPGNAVAVVPPYDDAAAEIAMYKNPLLEDDIAVQIFDGEECIPFVLFVDNGWFTPAMDMSGEKTLVVKPQRQIGS